MINVESEILIVGGGSAGLAAAVAASERSRVTIVDDNPHLGGQIWRAELGKVKSLDAQRLIEQANAGKVTIINNAQVFGADNNGHLLAETPDGTLELQFEKLILATGARERFLPFPGWTLPGVYGAGGLQAMVKGGMKIKSKRVVVAGTGPLLLAVADYLKAKGAKIICIAEQAPAANISRFALGLWRSPNKIPQAVSLRARLLGIPYLTDSWVTKCENRSMSTSEISRSSESPLEMGGLPQPLGIKLNRNGTPFYFDCDYLACGFHLIPNIELATVLSCKIDKGLVLVNELQQTSVDNIFCAGEPTGIGGVEASLIEGRIAGLAASGQTDAARSHFAKREKTQKFENALNAAFSLRDDLKTLADDDTIVCRCEDVEYAHLTEFTNFRDAKLQTRCGMGPCQGRICGAATEFMFGWKSGSVRPPIFPVKMENL
jgi:NADPH-dependent 2,4-dienoyl-CoA reductase/sulfur reductase-like enzyme